MPVLREAMHIVLFRDDKAELRVYGVILCRLMPSATNPIRSANVRTPVSCGVYRGQVFHQRLMLAERSGVAQE